MAKKKKADQMRELYHLADNWTRRQWEFTNQRGYDFAHDEQLSQEEKEALDDQGMPTFTVNRILPVVEMLNYYATANNPRWQAVGTEGSDTDVAAVLSDLSDYMWHGSDGNTLFSNAINDSICKGLGYLMVDVDKNADEGMGEVVFRQPEPFDIYVDPKSRDLLFKDAAFIMIRKVLPKGHLQKIYPEYKSKINKAASDERANQSWSDRAMGDIDQKLFTYNDQNDQQYAINPDGSMDELVELFELYEKEKISYMNVFYRIPPNPEELKAIKREVKLKVAEKEKEMQVVIQEQQMKFEQAVQSGEMIPERAQLEMEKMQQKMQMELAGMEQQAMSDLQNKASVVTNKVISEKEFKELKKNPSFAKYIVEAVQFYGSRIKQCVVAGDQFLYEKYLPETIQDYPIVPFHFKWTGTPFPISAVSPLVGKQMEINKAHQIMVHNASLGSSLRWMYEEGSVDAELWEKYSSSPGALLPVRPGVERPTPVMPAPLSNAFFSVVQQGKQDVEYLAGIYSSMMGNPNEGAETYRGMLAMDEYGTRRIKQWMKNCIEPALRQLGLVSLQYAQATYSAHKKFRIVQPNSISEQTGEERQINIPIYNDMGKAIGKSMDITSLKFDVRMVVGSTLPINRWAYLEELKQLMQLGVIDDIALLAETDIKNKENIVQRKSMYAQLQGQIQQLSEAMKDKEGTIETLTRQLVQAGIKGKVQDAEMEINKKKNEVKGRVEKEYVETEGKQKLLRNVMANAVEKQKGDIESSVNNFQKDLERQKKDSANQKKSD